MVLENLSKLHETEILRFTEILKSAIKDFADLLLIKYSTVCISFSENTTALILFLTVPIQNLR